MNHSTRAQWIDYLYEESPAEVRAELTAHAAACPECSAQLSSWREVSDKLNAWTIASPRRPSMVLRNAVKWGVAAMLMISLGFGLARMTAPAEDPAEIRNSLRAEFRQELNEARAEDQQRWAALIADMERLRAADYAVLRKDLDTVAVTAEVSLRRALRQIGELNLIAQSGNNLSLNLQ